MYDIVIRGGTVIDGTGNAAFTGDLQSRTVGSLGSVGSRDLLGARSMPRG